MRRVGLGVALCALVVLSGCPRDAPDQSMIAKSNTRLDLAKDFLSKGQIEAAESEGQKALGFYSDNVEAHYVLGLVDYMRGLSAFSLLEVDECLTGLDADVLREEKDKHLVAAMTHFARANELDAEFGEPWASRGAVASLLGQYEEAVKHLTTALGLPARLQNIALVRANLGWANFHRDDMVGAAKELLQANQFQPGMCVATYRLGRVYFARKEWEKALQRFREVTSRTECPIQEAHLYLMKTTVTMGTADQTTLQESAASCVALAPRSCVAAQCRALSSTGAPVPGVRPDTGPSPESD